MKERPILFSAPMVRAILNGRKTQTRRLVKPQPHVDGMGNFCWNGWNYGQDLGRQPRVQAIASPIPSSRTKRVLCPYGAVGDRLWVRETWGYRCGVGVNPTTEAVIEYRADESRANLPIPAGLSGLPRQRPNMTDAQLLAWWESWRPSIHMPRWASRITLEVAGVRVERLKNITDADAQAEGADPATPMDDPSRRFERPHFVGFYSLWESINGTGSWDANPWVWVVEFKRVEQAHG